MLRYRISALMEISLYHIDVATDFYVHLSRRGSNITTSVTSGGLCQAHVHGVNGFCTRKRCLAIGEPVGPTPASNLRRKLRA